MRHISLDRPIAGKALNFTEKVGDFGKFPPSSPLKSKSSDMKQKGKSNIQSGTSYYNYRFLVSVFWYLGLVPVHTMQILKIRNYFFSSCISHMAPWGLF